MHQLSFLSSEAVVASPYLQSPDSDESPGHSQVSPNVVPEAEVTPHPEHPDDRSPISPPVIPPGQVRPDPSLEISQPCSPAHPLPHGTLWSSPGSHFTYEIIGPCCRLFDREELPWPCCRLQWRGKEPSWRRIGRRFVVDCSTVRFPSYSARLVEGGHQGEHQVITLYGRPLDQARKLWWYNNDRSSHQDL